MSNLPYDECNPLEIEKYSKQLIGKRFSDILEDNITDKKILSELKQYYNNPKSKGGLGNLVEKHFFYYEPNSNSEPDFPKAGVELKVTPYEMLKNNKFKAGERLVIGMIPNNYPIETNFDNSHVLDKLKLVLLVLYLRERGIERLNYQINYSKLFSILGEECKNDLEIIKSDYKIITEKIISGKAHELSESDTMYLGACTKGATAISSLKPQYYNKEVPAKRRAFSLKQGYMTYILNKYIFEDIETYEPIVEKENVNKEQFEEIILSKIYKYAGWTEEELRKEFKLQDSRGYQIFSSLSFAMLGIKSNQAEEFVKSNTIVKAIRVEKNGSIKENISFPAINFLDFANEEWEESQVYKYFSENRFLFVIYKSNGDEYLLEKALFWNMPMNELDGVGKKEWLENQKIIREGVKFTPKENKVHNNLPNSKDTEMFHLRPHSKKSVYLINGVKYGNGILEKDADILPNGDKMVKQSFWLNKEYIKKIIISNKIV